MKTNVTLKLDADWESGTADATWSEKVRRVAYNGASPRLTRGMGFHSLDTDPS